MRNSIKALTAALLTTLLGCAPAPTGYCKPKAAFGDLVTGGCGTIVGPKDALKLVYDRVNIPARSYSGGVSIEVFIPTDVTAMFTSYENIVENNLKGTKKVIKIKSITYVDEKKRQKVEIGSLYPMRVYTRSLLFGGTSSRTFQA